MRESCRDCHKKNFKTYDDSLHAALVKQGPRDGRKDAPICSDCHNPHTLLSSKQVLPLAEVPCAKCHEAIFKAYAKDLHGVERESKGKSAPICADCHTAHAVQAASLGSTVRDACLKCHDQAFAQHHLPVPVREHIAQRRRSAMALDAGFLGLFHRKTYLGVLLGMDDGAIAADHAHAGNIFLLGNVVNYFFSYIALVHQHGVARTRNNGLCDLRHVGRNDVLKFFLAVPEK
jgi:hypothetical protein